MSPQLDLKPICLLLGKINAHYFSREDFTTNNSKCISIRKGEVAQLLEVQPSGWWKMNVEGVVGWTPGDFWDILQVGFVQEQLLLQLSAAWTHKRGKWVVFHCYIAGVFSRYSAPIHWLVHGHITSCNETVSRQMP